MSHKSIYFQPPEVQEDANKDSGYKGSSGERDGNALNMSCDEPLAEKEPLHLADNNSPTKRNFKAEFSEKLQIVENINGTAVNEEDEMEFSITRQVFSEHRSSEFKYESPAADKRLRREYSSTQSSQRYSQSSVMQCTLSLVLDNTLI